MPQEGKEAIIMAKKNQNPAAQTAAAAQPTIVTIKDLVTETGFDARKIRATIRSIGFNAPAIENAEGFGPKAKYEWPSNSPDLAKIRASLAESKAKAAAEAAPAAKPAAKAGKPAAAPVVETEDDEDDE